MSPGLPGPSAQAPVWEEPVRGFYTDPGQFVTLSGLDLLRGMLEAGLGPPIRYLFGLAPTSVEPGGVTFTMPVTDWLLFPQGVVSGATLGILVDAPLGCAVQTALPPATPFTTAEISFKFLRTVVPKSGTLTVRQADPRRPEYGRLPVEVTDEAGRLLAVTSTRCAILPRVEVPWEVIEQALKNPPRLREPEWPSPHPYERPVVGEVLAQDIWDGMDGLGVLRSLITGDLPAPPLAHFCGIAPVAAEAGTTTWKMPASEWLCAPSRDGCTAVPSPCSLARPSTARCRRPSRPVRPSPRGPQGVFPAPGSTRRPRPRGQGNSDPSRPQHRDRHLGGVRRGRQEGCRRDRISRHPAWPASDRDN